MKILYITSFSSDMFESGKSLINSFQKLKKHNSDLLLCKEGDFTFDGILEYDLRNCKFLFDFLKKYENYIPIKLGGKALNYCDCKVQNPYGLHLHNCHNSYWNSNFSRWFRKIASVFYATQQYDYDWFIWLDCDCLIKKIPSRIFFFDINHDVFYLFGKYRPQVNLRVESGVFGFKNKKFIEDIWHEYNSGQFLAYDRWDDGNIIQKVIETNKFSCIDLAEFSGIKNVLEDSKLSNFFIHNIGSHKDKGIYDLK